MSQLHAQLHLISVWKLWRRRRRRNTLCAK